MRRRAYLRGAALAGTGLAAAGCLSSAESGGFPVPPALEDPPAAVYRPTSVGGARLVGTARSGPFRFGLFYTYPTRFWEVVGRTTYRRPVEETDTVHLMATAWDPGSGQVLPEVGLTVEVRRDGELVTEEAVYAMVSQRTGFHYGDNFALPGDGRYAVRVRVGGVRVRRTGTFEGRFEEPASGVVPFEYRRADRNAIDRRRVDDAGSAGAVDPGTLRGVPNAVLPPVGSLQGRHLGSVRTGGAVLEVLHLVGEAAARFDAGAGADGYLAVLARTPHNRFLLPAMGLSGRLVRDDGPVTEGRFERTLDPDLGYHYGLSVGSIASGDELVLAVTTPPQVARHEGYETAFVRMPAASLTVG